MSDDQVLEFRVIYTREIKIVSYDGCYSVMVLRTRFTLYNAQI